MANTAKPDRVNRFVRTSIFLTITFCAIPGTAQAARTSRFRIAQTEKPPVLKAFLTGASPATELPVADCLHREVERNAI